jgi:hypothetical protein
MPGLGALNKINRSLPRRRKDERVPLLAWPREKENFTLMAFFSATTDKGTSLTCRSFRGPWLSTALQRQHVTSA